MYSNSRDNLEIENGDIFIDGKIQDNPNRAIIQHAYWVHYEKEVRKLGAN